MTISAPPPEPVRTMSASAFIAAAAAFVAWFKTFVVELNAAIGAFGVTQWNGATAYAVGDRVWSPVNFQTYRSKTVHTVNTDPSADTTNWAALVLDGAAMAQAQLATAFTTGGTAAAFTLTPNPAITANAANQRFRVKFHATAGAAPTLAISGQAALNLKYKDGAGAKQAVTAVQAPAGWIGDVENDGVDWVLLDVPISPQGGVPQNSQSSNYTTVLSDAGKHIYHPAADVTARVWTIDSNANVPYPIGTAITFDNDFGAGAVTIAITADTLVLVGAAGSTGSRTLASGGQATAIKVTATRWRISGVGLT